MSRYIDTDTLTDETKSLHTTLTGSHTLIEDMEAFRESTLRIINEQATADVAEVKHGKWISDDIFDNGKSSCFHCSECSFRYCPPVLMTSEGLAKSKRYCESCGAKMF